MNQTTANEIIGLMYNYGGISVGTEKSNNIDSLGYQITTLSPKNYILYGYSPKTMRDYCNKFSKLGLVKKTVKRTSQIIYVHKTVYRRSKNFRIKEDSNYKFVKSQGKYQMIVTRNKYKINELFINQIKLVLSGKITLNSVIESAKYWKNQLFIFLKTNKNDEENKGILLKMRDWWYGLKYNENYWSKRLKLNRLKH